MSRPVEVIKAEFMKAREDFYNTQKLGQEIENIKASVRVINTMMELNAALEEMNQRLKKQNDGLIQLINEMTFNSPEDNPGKHWRDFSWVPGRVKELLGFGARK